MRSQVARGPRSAAKDAFDVTDVLHQARGKLAALIRAFIACSSDSVHRSLPLSCGRTTWTMLRQKGDGIPERCHRALASFTHEAKRRVQRSADRDRFSLSGGIDGNEVIAVGARARVTHG